MPKGRRRRTVGVQKPAAGGAATTSASAATDPRTPGSHTPMGQESMAPRNVPLNNNFLFFNLSSTDAHTSPEDAFEGLVDGQNDPSQLIEYDPMSDFDDLGMTVEFSEHLLPSVFSPSVDLMSLDQEHTTLPTLNEHTSATEAIIAPNCTTHSTTSEELEKIPKNGSITAAPGADDADATQDKITDLARYTLLTPASSASSSRPGTKHGAISLTSALPKHVGQRCQCLETSSRLMEVWEGHQQNRSNNSIDSLLVLQRQTIQQGHSVLACEFCSIKSSSMMLPLMLCEKLVLSLQCNEPYFRTGAGKGKVGNFEVRTGQEWAELMRALSALQSNATSELIQRFRMIAQSAGWQTQLAILVKIEERFHSTVRNQVVRSKDPL
ncbi:hypothetical protein SLS60_002544 [Paraconiothyrium brasiliense]|uniref:Uncharacterized protein n=1 Tax=Paraconiothyrium brasiliense TaxID=300254 RepID=A0ABR3RT66_9PLEO